MKPFSFVILFTGLVAASGMAFAASETWTGTISDSMCEGDHSMMTAAGKADNKKCTLECVKAGSKFVFVSQGKVFAIANQELPALTTYAGDKVTLTGELQADGKTIKADTLEAAK